MWKGSSTRAIPVHDVVSGIDSSVAESLPAIHALSGCDSTSKIGTKKSALKTAQALRCEQVLSFAKAPIMDGMIRSAEKYLVACISSDNTVGTFDKLRYNIYHKKTFQLDLEKLPCTSASVHLHIKRAYLQCYRWLHAPYLENVPLDPTEYGYTLDKKGQLSPEIVHDVLPSDFPTPCNSTQLNVYLPILENIDTIIEHQMAGCQRGLSLSKLATHGYNNVITTHINAL